MEATPWTAHNMVAEDGSPMSADDIGLYVANSIRLTRDSGGFDHFLFVSDAEGKDVCLIGNGPRGPKNANLIASAPELLEFAQYVADMDPESEAPLFAKARAAIARATGEAQ